MIESCFCIRCNRPYATSYFGMCDSCLKDIEHEIRQGKGLIKPDPKMEKLILELIDGVDLEPTPPEFIKTVDKHFWGLA